VQKKKSAVKLLNQRTDKRASLKRKPGRKHIEKKAGKGEKEEKTRCQKGSRVERRRPKKI